MTIRELLARMLADRTDLRRTTRISYRVELQRLADLFDVDPGTLTAPQMERWAGSDQLRRRTLKTLKSLLNWAMRVGLVSANPVAPCKGPRVRTLTNRPGIHRALELPLAFAKPRDRALVTFLLDSGLRIREALGLTWDRVDLTNRSVLVDRALDTLGQYQGLKTEGAERDLVLSSRTVELLRDIRPILAQGPVFRNRYGGHLDAHNWHCRVWKPTLQRAGIRLRIHDLRHACATYLLEAGLPIAAVQQRLGHSSIETTMRHYARRSAKLSRDAASAMDQILGHQ